MAYAKKRKYHKRRYAKKAKTATIKSVVKSVLNKQEETKQYGLDAEIPVGNLYNDIPVTISHLQAMATGVADGQRTGSQVFIKNVVIKHRFFSSTVSLSQLNAVFRVLLIWSDKLILANNAYVSFPSTPLAFVGGEIFFGRTASSTRWASSLVNNKLEGQVVSDKLIKVSSPNPTNTIDGFTMQTIKINKKLTYLGGTGYTKNRNLYCVIIPQVPQVASGSLIQWGINTQAVVTYKDA